MKAGRKVLLLVSVVAVSALIGYSLGIKQIPLSGPPQSAPPSQTTLSGPESIVKNQQAQATGEISKKDGSSITIKGPDNQTATFKLSKSLLIYPLSQNPKTPPKPSTDSASLKSGQKVQLMLQLEGKEYLVTSISFLP